MSTTVDDWTVDHRSYVLGNDCPLDRLTHFKAPQSSYCTHKNQSKIEQIHVNHSLTGKVRATITDNGSNFVKAFSMYSLLDSSDIAVTIAEEAE